MYVTHVALDDFRSYQHAVVELEPGVTVLTGSNGQGKTNFVEALGYLSTLSSHRVGADSALVRATASPPQPKGAVIRAKVRRGERDKILEIEIIAGKANRARINRAPVPPRQLPGQLRTVTFSPEDLALVKAEPGVRRRFLDDGLIQLSPAYASLKTEHDKIVRQRGALLKQMRQGKAQYADATLEIWNQQLADTAAQVILARQDLVAKLQSPADQAHEQVARGARKLGLKYVAAVDQIVPAPVAGDVSVAGETTRAPDTSHGTDDAPVAPETESVEQLSARLLEAMKIRYKDEVSRGVNLVGAHRDDLDIQLDHLPVRGYASHGESWSVALALRLGMFTVLGGEDAEPAEQPILILDDVFAELDADRRESLARLVSGAEQVLITAAVPQDLPPSLQARQLRVRRDEDEGTLVESSAVLGEVSGEE